MSSTLRPLDETRPEVANKKKLSDFLNQEFNTAFSKEPGLEKLKDAEGKTESVLFRIIHLDFSIPMGIILLLMLVMGFFAYFESGNTSNGQAGNGRLKNVIEVVVGVGTVGGLITTAFNLHYQNHYLRKQYSARYISKWYSKDMVDKQEKFRAIRDAIEANDCQQLEKCIQDIRKTSPTERDKPSAEILYYRAVGLLHFFEQMSQDCLTNVADSSYLKEFFWYIARRYYYSCEDIISSYRRYTGRDLCFKDFELLIQKWEREGQPQLVQQIQRQKEHPNITDMLSY